MKGWEYLAWAGFLLLALIAGLSLGNLVAPEPVIGVVRFEGYIDPTTGTELVEVLERARRDSRVAGVVLEILSPGGLAPSSESVFYSMLKLRAEKPVMVVVDGIALSGGYYIAAAGGRVYAPASAYVGNVGARGARPGDPLLVPEELSSGPYKINGGSRFDRIHQLDLVKRAFLENVVFQRQNAPNPLTLDRSTLSEGRVYLGSEAVAVGLVDQEGGLSDAILAAAESAGISSYSVVRLVDYFGLERSESVPAMQVDFRAGLKTLVENAPPDAVFLVDSRLTLPGLSERSAVEEHMLKLRAAFPGSLEGADARSQSAVPENLGPENLGPESTGQEAAGGK